MSKKVALILAGLITALAVVFVLGASAIAGAPGQDAAVPATTAGMTVSVSDEPALQAQLNDYQAALEQANTQLQDAYNQIAALQAQSGDEDEHEEREHGGGFFFPFGDD
jgi:uncharacterized protein YlxW (UPF0749 family)